MAKPGQETVEYEESTSLDDFEDDDVEEKEEPEKDTKPNRQKRDLTVKSWIPDYDDEETEEKTEEETAEPQTEDKQEEFDEIVYNKETVKIPKSERQTYLQKGYNYDKVYGKLNETTNLVKQIETLSGMNISDVLSFMQKQKEDNDVQSLANEKGLAEDEAREIVRERERARIQRQEAERIRNEAEVIRQKEALKDRPFFKQLEAEIDNMVQSTPGLDVETAFTYLKGQRMDELVQQDRSNTQRKVVADMADKAKRSVETNSDSKKAEDVLTPRQKQLAKLFGVPLKEVAKRVR